MREKSPSSRTRRDARQSTAAGAAGRGDSAGTRDATEELKASEQSLRALLDQLPAILWTTDAALRFTSSRGAGLEALGRKPDEVVGRALADVVGEDPDGEPHVAVQAARRALAGEATRYVDGFSGRRYDVWVQPLRDSRGIVCGTVGTAVEITERERAQEMLRRQSIDWW